MKSYDVYLFDIDDTLVNTFEHVTSIIYPQLAKQLGLSYPPEKPLQSTWGGDIYDSLRNVFGNSIDAESALVKLRNLHRRIPSRPIQGVKPIFSVLKKHHKSIGLFSASDPDLIEHNINHVLELHEHDVDFVLSTVRQEIPKPSPQIIFIMLDAYFRIHKQSPNLDRVLVIGDSVNDMNMARFAGVDFAAVLTGVTDLNAFLSEDIDPNMIFSSVQEAIRPQSEHGVVAIIKNDSNQFLFVQEARKGHPYHGCWSGPHGTCQSTDILEEESVCRESFEECGIEVIPVRKLYSTKADTKVKTVSFWEARLSTKEHLVFKPCPREVADIRWVDLEDIKNEKVPLYPGTRSFFENYYNLGS